MRAKSFFCVCAGLFLLCCVSTTAADEEPPSSMTCTCNAKTWRDFDFMGGKGWGGKRSGVFPAPFGITTPERPDPDLPLRDKVFSNLQGKVALVRSITPADKWGPEQATEFEAAVILRSEDGVTLIWSNDINKSWMAVLDFNSKKAVVTQVFQGVSSVGGELETLDCK